MTNREKMMFQFQTGREFTAEDLANRTGISRAHVTRLTAEFVRKGLITSEAGSGGWRPAIYKIAPGAIQ